MITSTLQILALANVADRSWHGELSAAQLADRAYTITDLFVGQITYFDRETWVTYSSGSYRMPLIGHLFCLGEALTTTGSDSVGTFVNEWRIEVDVTPGGVECTFPGAAALHLDTGPFRLEVAGALASCLSLLKAAAGPRPLPVFLDEVQQVVDRLLELDGDLAPQSPPKIYVDWDPVAGNHIRTNQPGP